jgi:hypothetical protein
MNPAHEAASAADLNALHTQLAVESNAARILNERSRTIDQIKRLYTVVMGFSLTTAVGNAYLCERAVEMKSFEVRFILFGPVFCLGSILVLFCLGAERFFDQKYLHPTSERPNWGGLTLDLAVLGAAAGIFVVLANSFQPVASPFKLDDLYKDQLLFILNLAILYGIDVACLLLQCITLKIEGATGRSTPEHLYGSHRRWFFTNLFLTIVFSLSYKFSNEVTAAIGVFGIAVALVFIHAVRFAYDFGGGFDFYYPKEAMPDSKELLQKPA